MLVFDPAEALVPIHMFTFRGQDFVLDRDRRTAYRLDPQSAETLTRHSRGETLADYDNAASDRTSCVADLEAAGLLTPRRDVVMAAPEAPERPQIHSVDFHVTNACNLGCVYCYGFDGAGYLNRPDGMTWDVAERAIGFLCEHAPEKRPFTLYFFGGEPLLNFRLIERIIPFAKSEFAEAGKRIQSP